MKCDWLFINKICYYLYYFGLVPSYNFQHAQTYYWRKFYIIILVILTNVCIIQQFYVHIYDQHDFVLMIMDATELSVEGITMNVILIETNFINKQHWKNLFQKIDDLETYFEDKFVPDTNLMKLLMISLLFLILWICPTSYEVYLVFPSDYTLFHLITIYQTLNCILIINLLMYFKRRNEYVYNILKKCVRSNRKIEELKYIIEIHRKTNKLFDGFNKIFGSFIFLFIPYFVLLNVYWISLDLFQYFDDFWLLFLLYISLHSVIISYIIFY